MINRGALRVRARERSPIAKKIWLTIHPRNFGCDVSVCRPSVHSLEGGGREGNQVSARQGRSMLYFLGGKSCDAFVQLAFFLAGNRARNCVVIVVAFKNLFALGTCF